MRALSDGLESLRLLAEGARPRQACALFPTPGELVDAVRIPMIAAGAIAPGPWVVGTLVLRGKQLIDGHSLCDDAPINGTRDVHERAQ
jgi:hypothetical protein